MAKKFKAKNMAKLDSPIRRELLPPGDVLNVLDLKTGDIFLDAGAGIGYFSIPAAKIVAPDGMVYATDISKDMLEELTRRSSEKGITEYIETVISTEYEMKVPTGIVDIALTSTVLHEVEDKKRFLKAMADTLKTGGKLAVLEWKNQPAEYGPPQHHRCSEKETLSLLEELGCTGLKSESFSNHFYLVMGTYGADL